ncbi:hypothetical protein VTJ49DRAFT_5142 [Mycothermus thermophilus]|uniref:Protein kinase domain-containing protein n=1 Tax=Humicola insolens TaxID=85995 RepID=A0ABR3V3S8_HUMIN
MPMALLSPSTGLVVDSSSSKAMKVWKDVLLRLTPEFMPVTFNLPWPLPKPIPTEPIRNLCETLQKNPTLNPGEWYGRLAGGQPLALSKSFCAVQAPYFDTGIHEDCDLVPLSEVVSGPVARTRPVLHDEKIHLAKIIVMAMIQLHDTPWIPEIPTLDIIHLAKKNGVISYREAFALHTSSTFSRPHGGHRYTDSGTMPNGVSTNAPNSDSGDILNSARMLGLGMILIELMTGTLFLNRHFAPFPTSWNFWEYAAAYEAATQHLGMVNRIGGFNYYRAVSLCVRNTLFDKPSMPEQLFGILEILEKEEVQGWR